MKLALHPLTPERWPDLEALFAARGCAQARQCWCMYYRATGTGSELGGAARAAAHRRGLKSLVDAGRPPGLIGYRGGEPVGWVALGPREDFPKLARSPVMKPVDDRPHAQPVSRPGAVRARRHARRVRDAGTVRCGCHRHRDLPARVAQVRASEEAFARSMADRDFMAFGSFIADDAVFVNGGRPLRGKPAILAFWKRFFDVPNAPFSWKPEVTEVIARGDIGYTTGPVTSAAGSITAHFHSTWRLGPDGRWRIVFDNGYPACACER